MSLRRATLWSLIWIGAALGFAGTLAAWRGVGDAQLFLAGYVLEKSLSVDNLMVFAAIFSYFRIATKDQPRILYYGFAGAVVFRFAFLVGGAVLLNLHPVIGAVFGVLVLWSGLKMLTMGDGSADVDYEAQWFVRLARKLSTTPAFICLVAIEISDIMFSFDSMPAVLAVVSDPLIVYSAVIFAVLGLRSLYFVLDALMRYLAHLNKAVIAILFFVGAKLVLQSASEIVGIDAVNVLDVSPMMNLAVVLGLLSLGIIASAFTARAA